MENKIVLPKISNLFRSTFSFSVGHWKELLFIMGLPLGFQELYAYANSIVIPALGNAHVGFALLYLLFTLLLVVVLPVFFFYSVAVVILYIKNSLDGINSMGKAYKDTFRYIFPFIWVLILVDLCVYGASVFLIIPGIIVFIYLQFTLPLVMDGKYKGLSAISASFQLVKGNWWSLFGRMLLLALVDIILGLIFITVAVTVSYLFAHPGVSLVAYAKNHVEIISLAFTISSWIYSAISMPYVWILYRSVLKVKEEGFLAEEEIKKSRGFFMGLSIWGLVAGIFIFMTLIIIVVISAFTAARHKYDSLQGIASSKAAIVANDASSSMLTYTDSVYGFSIKYPADWQIDPENTNSPYSIFFIAPVVENASPAQGLRGSVVVNITERPAPQDFEEVSREFESEVAYEATTLKDDWTILSKESITFLGLPAYQYSTTKLRTFDNGQTFVTQQSQTILFVKNNLIYDVEYKNDVADFDLMKPLGDQIISTLKIK